MKIAEIAVITALCILLMLIWGSGGNHEKGGGASAQTIKYMPLESPDDGLPNGKILQKEEHGKAVRGDTVLINEGVFAVKVDDKKQIFMAVSGGDSRRVIRKGDTLRMARFNPTNEQSGIFEQKIDEDMITRASAEAPNYKISSGGGYVQFLYAGGNVPAESVETISNGWVWDYGTYSVKVTGDLATVKETLTLKSGAPVEYWWAIDSNEPKHSNGYGRFKIPALTAVDAEGADVSITEKYTWDSGWRLTATIDTTGAAFPIMIDPSVRDTTIYAGTNSYILTAGQATYFSARNATSGDAFGIDTYIGQATNVSSLYSVRRGYLYFVTPIPTGALIDSGKLQLDGMADQSATDFNLILTTGFFDVNLGAAGFNAFHGWAASGAYTGVKPHNKVWSTTSYSASYNDIYFNGNGLDTIYAHRNDTLKYVLLSSRDSSETTPGTGSNILEYIQLSAATAPKARMIVYYRTISLSCSLSYCSTYDSIRVHAYGDTALVDSTRAYKIIGTDTTALTAWQVTPAVTFFDSAFGNQNYTIIVRGKTSTASYWSNKDTILSKPDTATSSFIGKTAISITIQPRVGDNNTPSTRISIMDSSRTRTKGHRLFLTLAGDTSTVERFYTATQWGTVTADGFVRGQWGIFAVRAQNNDSTYKSAFTIDSTQIAVNFASIAFSTIDTNKVRVVATADTFAYGKRIKVFAYDVNLDTTWGDSLDFTEAQFSDTLVMPDSLNKKYWVRGSITDSANAIYYSTLDSLRTWAWQISSASGTWANDSVLVITLTNHVTNPANTGIKLIDSARVTGGYAAKWINPNTGYTSTAYYQSAAAWNGDSLLFPATSRIPGASIKLRFIVDNLDSAGAN